MILPKQQAGPGTSYAKVENFPRYADIRLASVKPTLLSDPASIYHHHDLSTFMFLIFSYLSVHSLA